MQDIGNDSEKRARAEQPAAAKTTINPGLGAGVGAGKDTGSGVGTRASVGTGAGAIRAGKINADLARAEAEFEKDSSAANAYPSQIKYIVGNEAAERFSFYGMRSILTVFMVQTLLIAESDAKAIYHLFVSACYLLPLLGAYISDKLIGRYNTILYLSLLYCLGHGTLAVWESKSGLMAGLALIALGSGAIKPCVSAFVGDQFTEKNKQLVQKVYNLFYFSINFGSFFSTLLIPWVLPRFGASWAFGIPGILMGIATLIFWAGRKQYVKVPPTRKSSEASFASILYYSLSNMKQRRAGSEFFDVALQKFSLQEVENAKSAARVFKVLLPVSAFWALFDQHGSSWVLQATKMNLTFLGSKWEASQPAALNPIMVMGLIPLFTYVIYPGLEKMGLKLTPLRRMSVGMLLASLSFVIVGFIQMAIDGGTSPNIGWQIIPYLVLTISEVMISVTGLEFAYSQAPTSMKSTIMSFWLLTVFVGNLLTAYVSKVNVFQGSAFFFFFAGLMFVLALVFVRIAAGYKMQDHFRKA